MAGLEITIGGAPEDAAKIARFALQALPAGPRAVFDRANTLTVKLDNGSLVAITQEADATVFNPGDRVRIISSGGGSRVTRY